MKKLVSLFLSLSLLLALAACKSEGGDTTNNPNENAPAAATEIYFLNFKPEIASVYEKIAKEYKEKIYKSKGYKFAATVSQDIRDIQAAIERILLENDIETQ